MWLADDMHDNSLVILDVIKAMLGFFFTGNEYDV